MKSANFVYQTIGNKILKFMPEASLEYSESFWGEFEPYFFPAGENVQAFAGELVKTDQEAVKCVFKMSQFEDNLVRQEYNILQSLATTFGADFPHICKPYGIVKYKSHVQIAHGIHDDGDDPFVIREMLLLEKIPAICDLGDFAQQCTNSNYALSLFKQVLLCIRLFRGAGLTHFDLHTGNILVRRCSPHLTLEYHIDGEQFCVPTFGYVAVIIDFGFSYLRAEEPPSSLNCTLRCIHYGLITDRYMPFTDYIRFMYNICGDIRQCTQNWKQALRRKILKLFQKNNFISKKSGWFKTDAPDQLEKMQQQMRRRNIILFQHYDWIELTQILIQRLEPCDASDDAPEHFAREWAKIEERITDKALITYLYKYFISHVHLFRSDPDRDVLVKRIFLEEFTRLVNAFIPIVDYTVLIQRSLELAAYLQAFLYDYVSAREAEIIQNYQSLPFSSENCDNYIWKQFESFVLPPTQQRLLIKQQDQSSHQDEHNPVENVSEGGDG